MNHQLEKLYDNDDENKWDILNKFNFSQFWYLEFVLNKYKSIIYANT